MLKYNVDSKWISFLLEFCWGLIGVHQFIMGEKKKAIVKLVGYLLCGVVSIVLTIMNLIKIYKGTYEINPDAWF